MSRISSRPDIVLPDGRVLVPRTRFARNVVGATDQSVAKIVDTIVIGGVAYCERDASLLKIATCVRRQRRKTKTTTVGGEIAA